MKVPGTLIPLLLLAGSMALSAQEPAPAGASVEGMVGESTARLFALSRGRVGPPGLGGASGCVQGRARAGGLQC